MFTGVYHLAYFRRFLPVKLGLCPTPRTTMLKKPGFIRAMNPSVLVFSFLKQLFEVSEPMTPSVELWIYWTMKKKIQETKIDKSFRGIIENHLARIVGRPIADLHFSKTISNKALDNLSVLNF